MIFSDVVNFMNEQAEIIGLPIYFGSDDNLNEQVNAIDGMFLTFDVPGGGMNKLPPAVRRYDVVLQCLDKSHYMTDNLQELLTLERTDLYINRLMSTFVCHFEVEGLKFVKIQGLYDSEKSGWRVTFSVTNDLLNYG